MALERTKPNGRVIGIDLIPAEPPRGVITFQGDFLSPMVQKLVKDLIADTHQRTSPPAKAEKESEDKVDDVDVDRASYIDMERFASQKPEMNCKGPQKTSLVDVCISLHRLKAQ